MIVIKNIVINEQIKPEMKPLKLHFFADINPLINAPIPTHPQKYTSVYNGKFDDLVRIIEIINDNIDTDITPIKDEMSRPIIFVTGMEKLVFLFLVCFLNI